MLEMPSRRKGAQEPYQYPGLWVLCVVGTSVRGKAVEGGMNWGWKADVREREDEGQLEGKTGRERELETLEFIKLFESFFEKNGRIVRNMGYLLR